MRSGGGESYVPVKRQRALDETDTAISTHGQRDDADAPCRGSGWPITARISGGGGGSVAECARASSGGGAQAGPSASDLSMK